MTVFVKLGWILLALLTAGADARAMSFLPDFMVRKAPEPVEEAGDPEPSDDLSGEDLNIRMEGLRRDFPDYYLNIQRQIQRCWQSAG